MFAASFLHDVNPTNLQLLGSQVQTLIFIDKFIEEVNLMQKNKSGMSLLDFLSAVYPTSFPNIDRAVMEAFTNINEDNRKAAINILHRSDKPEIINFLIAKGLDIDSPDKQGQTALYRAVSTKNLGLVTYLVGKGANPSYGRTENDKAIKHRKLSPLELAKNEKITKENLVKNIPEAGDTKVEDQIISILERGAKDF